MLLENKSVLAEPEKWLTIDEVKEYVVSRYGRHWSNTYVYSLIRAGVLPAYKVGTVLSRNSIDQLVKQFKRSAPKMDAE